MSELQNQAEGGRGDRRGGGVGRLKTCSRREETERQPGDWRAENREEHEEGRKEGWCGGEHMEGRAVQGTGKEGTQQQLH